jgi:tetratricopeptide (TPR) repeat protein
MFQDMMLDATLQMLDEDTTVILLSDHGFYSDHRRPVILPKEPAAIAMEHSPFGIFVAKGPNIKKDERIYGASILDITPTLLSIYGLPIGSDMDGKPLLQIFEQPPTPQLIQSWENIDGNSGQHPKDLSENTYEVIDEQALKQLADLGYIEDNQQEENADANFRNVINENRFYLARSYYNANEYYNAIEILEELIKEKPIKIRFVKFLLDSLMAVGNIKRYKEIVQMLKDLKKQEDSAAKTEQSPLDTPLREAGGLFLIEKAEAEILFKEKKYDEVIDLYNKFTNAQKLASRMFIAKTYYAMGRIDEAAALFIEAIKANNTDSDAYYHLGLCYLYTEKYDEAIDAFLDSIGLLYFNPMAHFYLGEAFFRAAMYLEASQAFEVALRLAPKMQRAYQKLKTI